MEKLDFLIKYLLKENTRLKQEKIPNTIEEKKRLFRVLCNIREPNKISQEFLKAEKEYLQEELEYKGITDVNSIDSIKESNLENSNKICIWQGDITTLKIDCIVNAANSQGIGCFIPLHNCVDNQIGSNSGVELRIECNEIMKNKEYNLNTSDVIITKGYNLPSKNIIHTVGPIIKDYVHDYEKEQLAKCYSNALDLAVKNNIRTIAFPCISTGVFRFPKVLACKIAFETVNNFLSKYNEEIDKVVFCLWSRGDVEVYEKYIRESSKD